jgi:replicative DNA helicase
MEWLRRSEIVAGKILKGELSPHAVDPSIMHPPFDRLVVRMREGAEEHELYDDVSTVAIQDAKTAASMVNGDIDEYVQACATSAIRVQVGNQLSPIVHRWKNGESRDGDIDKAVASLGKMDEGKAFTQPLGEAEIVEQVWRKTHYKPVDANFYGIPESSLTVVGGPPGTGKTSFLGRLLISAAEQDKKVAFFSLEMTMNQIAKRFMELDKKAMRSKKRRNNILVADSALTVNEIYAEAGRIAANHPDLYFVGIDFADMIIPDRWKSSGVEQVDTIYRTMAALAKQINVPVIVLSQLNMNYVGGRPRVSHLRGSRLIEALAAMVILLYNPNQIDVEQKDDLLVTRDDRGYFILGKSRYGFKYGSTIAVPVEWDGEQGWGQTYGDAVKLFSV